MRSPSTATSSPPKSPRAIAAEPLIELRREEVTHDSRRRRSSIIATGPLTSDALAAEIARLTGSDRLFFYDSISPIVDADTVDMTIAFCASRYGKSIDGTDDYLNCPFDQASSTSASSMSCCRREAVSARISRRTTRRYFEACLPIEEIARRGRDTLRFGPMKPMGLTDPRTGRRPWAVVQLRQENLRADSFNLVGFQNHLKFGEQARILRMIPGLEHAEFLRFGQIHRNTYINAPALLDADAAAATRPRVFFAGQISGVEGYVESIATGLMAGMPRRGAGARATARAPCRARRALGSLCHYISRRRPGAITSRPTSLSTCCRSSTKPRARRLRHDKKARHAEVCRRALDSVRRIPARACLSWRARSSATWKN